MAVNAKTEVTQSPMDKVYWAVLTLLVIAGVFANTYFSDIAVSIRLAAWLVLCVVLVFIALQTRLGRVFFEFTKDVRMELRKVVWPSQGQTVQTTGLVIVAVVIFSLILWAIDSLLLWAVNWLTG